MKNMIDQVLMYVLFIYYFISTFGLWKNMNGDDFVERLKIKTVPGSSNDSDFISGYVEDKEDFFKNLALLGYSFSVRSSKKLFDISHLNTEGDEVQLKSQILTKFEKNGIKVPWMGCLFLKEKSEFFQCSHGPNYYKKDTPQDDHEHVARKKRFQLLCTKKLDCEATLKVTKVIFFPKYKVSENCPWSSKKKIIQSLRNELGQLNGNDEEGLLKNVRYYISVSAPQKHNHSVTTSYFNQRVDKSVVNLIKSCVGKGMTSVQMIKNRIDQFNSDNGVTNKHARSFFPDERAIYNFVLKFTYLRRQSKIDQEALQIKIDSWKKDFPDLSIFYRPYSETNDGQVNTFLLCFQTAWQKQLLIRYGHICLLDATYKTCRYDLPLFFIVVKTNVGYIVAATFIIQTEDSQSIAEALRIIKDWNEQWNVEYFMTDFDNAEINAIRSVFNCTTYLCSFHRLQAWLRWLKNENLHKMENKNSILKLWKRAGDILDVQELNKYLLEMNKNPIFIEEEKAKRYFESTWLPQIENWSAAYFNREFSLKIRTNNGIEAQNYLLKHHFLKDQTDKSICNLVEIIIEKFLPESLLKYQNKNSKLSSEYKKYHAEMPVFLQQRPVFFTKHVYSRYATAKNVYSENSIQVTEESGVFSVQSEEKAEVFYEVNFNIPNCNCVDFQMHIYPCKHFCAVFLYVNNFSFDALPEKYRNSPYLTIDNAFNVFERLPACLSEPRNSIQENADNVTVQAVDANETNETEIIEMNISCEFTEDLQDNINIDDELRNKTNSRSDIRKQIQILLKNLTNKSYILNEEGDVENLLSIKKKLEETDAMMKKEIRQDSGLKIVPEVQRKRKDKLFELPVKKKKKRAKLSSLM